MPVHCPGHTLGKQLKEVQVVLGKLAGVRAPDLKYAERGMAPALDRHADHPAYLVPIHGFWHLDAVDPIQVPEMDELAGQPGQTRRSLKAHRNPAPSYHPHRVSDPSLQHERPSVRAMLEQAGKSGINPFGSDPASLAHDGVQVVLRMRKSAEPQG